MSVYFQLICGTSAVLGGSRNRSRPAVGGGGGGEGGEEEEIAAPSPGASRGFLRLFPFPSRYFLRVLFAC